VGRFTGKKGEMAGLIRKMDGRAGSENTIVDSHNNDKILKVIPPK